MLILILSCSNTIRVLHPHLSVEDITPVIIIGGGAAGLTTGIRLLELGISPILLEKEMNLAEQDSCRSFCREYKMAART